LGFAPKVNIVSAARTTMNSRSPLLDRLLFAGQLVYERRNNEESRCRLSLSARGWSLGIFILDCRDCDHLAVLMFAAQPTEKGAFERLGVETVVFARRCSRDTAVLDAWIRWASMPRALSQRASQKPSRPASKATAMRSILRPAFSASSRQPLTLLVH
jgi:hypothetical protein